MNAARRRTVPDGLPNRVYSKSGSYYWYPKSGSWIKLCRVEEGETKMLERLAAEKRKRESMTGIGNVPAIVDEYVKDKRAEHREKSWPLYGNYVKKCFANVNIDQVDNAMVVEFLNSNYKDKLPMKRTMRAFLSGFFRWCREKRYYSAENPCNGIRLKVPKARDVYITDEHFAAIRAELADDPMILCLVDLCYLTVQRSTEIRALRWKKEGTAANWIDRDNGVIHFMPSKTQDSSGIAVDWPITPEIDAVLEIARGLGKIKGPHVIHKATGAAWKASDALKVWRDACNRAKLQEFGYTIKDIRAKAITDARRAGYDIDALQVAAAHADKATTEIYFKDRTVPVSNVRLAIPKSA
ncbi:tyrosine-type recombinase/integrase [Paraburkholderia sp. WP4_3_2]|uniref:tyrosine-type recombinase/integrase n=1 Tax=Paraburkholderia sp. WP4_3_2 TaxID=2587162 RepID=UPI00161488DE|nr:tyrosine-type recombinase/integrase [Paraburkholderia sp. WP4_3_2]MBB3256913.1 integrase [Paraburkholderia sp. WP4_3_2]